MTLLLKEYRGWDDSHTKPFSFFFPLLLGCSHGGEWARLLSKDLASHRLPHLLRICPLTAGDRAIMASEASAFTGSPHTHDYGVTPMMLQFFPDLLPQLGPPVIRSGIPEQVMVTLRLIDRANCDRTQQISLLVLFCLLRRRLAHGALPFSSYANTTSAKTINPTCLL